MKKRRPVETNTDLIRVMVELFDEMDPETPEEVEASLREAGYAPDEIGTRMKAVAERALANSPLNWRNRAAKNLEEKQIDLTKFETELPEDRSKLIETIQQLLPKLEQRTGFAFAHHRNFETASDEDLKSLLIELQYLNSQQAKQDENDEEES